MGNQNKEYDVTQEANDYGVETATEEEILKELMNDENEVKEKAVQKKSSKIIQKYDIADVYNSINISNKYLRTIRNWLTFFGVLFIISVVIGVVFALRFLFA